MSKLQPKPATQPSPAAEPEPAPAAETPTSYALTPEERASMIAMNEAITGAQNQMKGALMLIANSHGLVGEVNLTTDCSQVWVRKK